MTPVHMKLLLISNSYQPNMGYLEHALPWVREHFASCKNIFFVPYALHNCEAYYKLAVAALEPMGLHVFSAHQSPNPKSMLDNCDGILMAGGNTSRLLKVLQEKDLLGVLRERALAATPYVGSSAGTVLACPTIMTTNDMPIARVSSFDALSLLPFQINPHYLDPLPNSQHMGETRQKRIEQFLEDNAVPVLGLREGSALKIAESMPLELLGKNPARLFRPGQEPVEISPGKVPENLLAGIKEK